MAKRKNKYEPPLCECKGCYYWRQMWFNLYACHYRLETHKLRDIPPIDCYMHKGTPYRSKKKNANNVL